MRICSLNPAFLEKAGQGIRPAIPALSNDGAAGRPELVKRRTHLPAGRQGTLNPSLFCVRPVGFEPTTTWSEAKCSIQLSYGRSQKSEGLSS